MNAKPDEHSSPQDWRDYKPCRYSSAYLMELWRFAVAHEAELPHGVHRKFMLDDFIPRHMLKETGGSLEVLTNAVALDQVEFDAVAAIPWAPSFHQTYWSSGISGGPVIIPEVSSLVEAVYYLQKKRRGSFGKYGITLTQPNIRKVVVRRDEPTKVMLYRPALYFAEHRRLRKTGYGITTEPMIEFEIPVPE